jgi:uridine kinase
MIGLSPRLCGENYHKQLIQKSIKIIGIAGGSGSGKTTFTKALASRLRRICPVTVIEQDSYYRDRSHLPQVKRSRINFDHPNAIDARLLKRHLLALKNNQPIRMPIYDFAAHSRKKATTLTTPTPIVLVEGILLFAHPLLTNLFDLKLFIDAPEDIRFIRRLVRDTQERGRSIDSVISQYLTTVRPMHLRYVQLSQKHADLILPGTGNPARPLQQTIKMVLTLLNKSKNSNFFRFRTK